MRSLYILTIFVALSACKSEQFGSFAGRQQATKTANIETNKFYETQDEKSKLNDVINEFVKDPSKDFTNANGYNLEKFKVETTSADSDVAFVIDTSASMGGEIAKVQANVAAFASRLAQDPRTTNYQLFILAGKNDKTFSPPAEVLNNPRFTFENSNHSVSSHNALSVAMGFMGGQITTPKISLRPNTIKHFIFVTDDEASNEAAFRQFLATSYAKQNIHIHGIACPSKGSGCVNKGNAYINLAADPKYSGMIHDIRTNDWSGIFEGIANSIATAADYALALSAIPKSQIDVFANGIKLNPSAYQYANGKLTILKSAVQPGSTVIVVY